MTELLRAPFHFLVHTVFCLHYYLGFFTTLFPQSERWQSVCVIPLLYNILQFFFFLHLKSIIFTEASPKPVPSLSTVCIVFHCAVVTLATFLLLQPTEPAPPVGRLHMLCVLKGYISLQLSARLLAAGALGLVLKVTSEA